MQRIRIDVVAADGRGFRVDTARRGRKHELPSPFETRARILARKRVRQPHLAVYFRQIPPVQSAHLAQKGAHLGFGKYDRQTNRPLRPDHPVQPWQIKFQHLRIEE